MYLYKEGMGDVLGINYGGSWKTKLLACVFALAIISMVVPGYGQVNNTSIGSNIDSTKTLEELAKLYQRSPDDADIYEKYLALLLAQKDYKTAEKIAESRLDRDVQNPELHYQLGMVYQAADKGKKAAEAFDKAIELIGGDDYLTQKFANRFQRDGQPKEAIKVYEAAIKVMRNPSLYAIPLGKLYAADGRVDEAVLLMIAGASQYYNSMQELESNLLEVLQGDEKNIQLAQKALIKQINATPDNQSLAELLTWLYTQKNDWEGALLQIRALDLRNKEAGKRLLDFSASAVQNQQYEVAAQAVEAVLKKGKESPLYAEAMMQSLQISYKQISMGKNLDAAAIAKTAASYKQTFEEYPQFYSAPLVQEYAALLALYANNIPDAIIVLEKSIEQPTASRQLIGANKLQLGDYLILQEKMWDASLYYSQVDKTFREDALGEEARFKNAKLAYYRGDFAWAQAQLNVLKASTTELIANDALFLSVLITENIGPDSNYVPLKRFAFADLLLFQNKVAEAMSLLDSLQQHYPEHPLNDDIFLLKAKVSLKQQKPEQAIAFLQQILSKYKDDVLADDALFTMAEIYERDLKKPDIARRYYEQLILEYMGSSFNQIARKRISSMSL